MIIADRLIAALARKNMSQSALARAAGISANMVNKLANGKAQGSSHIYDICRALDVTPDYLSGDVDDFGVELTERAIAPPSKPDANADTVQISEFELAYGLGASFIHGEHVHSKVRVFTRAWLRYFTDSPFKELMFARGIGDSMMPTILDSDLLLIDTSQQTPRMWDQLWAIDMGGMGMIKRLRPTKDGTGMQLLSANPDVPDETAYDGEMNVVGRVVAIMRKT